MHAVIGALGAGPVDLFASSGGAVTALALVATYPNDVATLVAHEPPMIPVVPDAAAATRGGGRMAGVSFSGVHEAIRALSAGRPVVVPNPSPQAYGVVGTDPGAVNAAKGRPPGQAVGAALHDEAEWRRLAPGLDLTPAAVTAAHTLLRSERVTMLLPLRDEPPPEWLRPSTRDGHVLVFGADLSVPGAAWAPLAALWGRFPRLYGSSANRTGEPAATTAADARRMFGGELVVVDGDAHLDRNVPHAPTTMLRMTPDGALALIRPGAQDAAHGGPEPYLRRLSRPDGPPA